MLPLYIVAAFYSKYYTLMEKCNIFIIVSFINSVTGVCCAYTNMGISIDRYRSIVQSNVKTKFSRRICLNMIAGIWLISILYSVPELIILITKKNKNYQDYLIDKQEPHVIESIQINSDFSRVVISSNPQLRSHNIPNELYLLNFGRKSKADFYMISNFNQINYGDTFNANLNKTFDPIDTIFDEVWTYNKITKIKRAQENSNEIKKKLKDLIISASSDRPNVPAKDLIYNDLNELIIFDQLCVSNDTTIRKYVYYCRKPLNKYVRFLNIMFSFVNDSKQISLSSFNSQDSKNNLPPSAGYPNSTKKLSIISKYNSSTIIYLQMYKSLPLKAEKSHIINFETGFECFLSNRENIISVALQMIVGCTLPLSVASILYVHIVCYLWKNNIKINSIRARCIRALQILAIQRSLRAIKMMIALLILYSMCSVPFYVLAILELVDHLDFSFNYFHLHNILILTDHWFHVGLYLYFNKTYRKAFCRTFEQLFYYLYTLTISTFRSSCIYQGHHSDQERKVLLRESKRYKESKSHLYSTLGGDLGDLKNGHYSIENTKDFRFNRVINDVLNMNPTIFLNHNNVRYLDYRSNIRIMKTTDNSALSDDIENQQISLKNLELNTNTEASDLHPSIDLQYDKGVLSMQDKDKKNENSHGYKIVKSEQNTNSGIPHERCSKRIYKKHEYNPLTHIFSKMSSRYKDKSIATNKPCRISPNNINFLRIFKKTNDQNKLSVPKIYVTAADNDGSDQNDD
ncbi:unnamed protein product [Gordionus sp. m RMFG-2023]